MATQSFKTAPPPTSFTRISTPAPYVLLVTLSRPKSLNCINSAGHVELHSIWQWFDYEPTLRVAVVTGEGRAFCAGADLKEWQGYSASSKERPPRPSSGFGGLSTRSGRKPIIAAVNGLCLGGGFEMVINIDMVLAAPHAMFSLPEVKRGVAAVAGALPRLPQIVGKQKAMEIALTGRMYTAQEARDFGVVNKVVGGGQDEVVKEAVRWAQEVAGNSPDSVVVSREGIKFGWEGMGVQEATEKLERDWYRGLADGENIKEGLKAFVEKRAPRWIDSKL